MEVLKKLWGFRSNVLWKKIIAYIYYFFCLIIILISFSNVPQIYANMYDMIIYKVSEVIKGLAFLIPILLISDFNIKGKIPLLKNKRWWSDVFGFVGIFIVVFCFSNVIFLFHSEDYKNRYEQFYTTDIIYQEQEKNESSDEDKSSSTIDGLEEKFDDLDDSENNDVNDSDISTDINNDKSENVNTEKDENNNQYIIIL